jgi:Rad3-related DNA helicase
MVNKERLLQCFPFDSYRKHQQEVMIQCVEAFDRGIRHVVVSAPVGIGKSAMALALGKYYGSSFIGTTQKSLQKQYCNDFDLPEFYGKSNYVCAKDPSQKCDNPSCKGEKQEGCICPYQQAKRDCFESNTSIMNYALLFSLAQFGGGFPHRPLATYDECHNLESVLTDFVGINITERAFKMFNIPLLPFPKEGSTTIEVVKWLDEMMIPHCTDQLTIIETALNGYCDDKAKKQFGRQYSFLDNFIRKIHFMISFIGNGGKVCTQVEDTTISMKPLMIDFMAKEMLEGISDFVLHMSATVQSKQLYCKCLGLDESEVEYIQVGSVFPPENRPVVFAPVGSMSYKNKKDTLPKMSVVIDRLLNERHQEERGIIHTGTYEIANYIYENSDCRDRLVYPKSGERDEIIRQFFESGRDDLVLLSPSLMEGIDLKGDLAKFSMVCKVPFASLADRWTKEKMDYIVGWYAEETINKLIQSTGRHIRSEEETGITYIMDETFKWFYNSNKFRFPKWWTESLILKR